MAERVDSPACSLSLLGCEPARQHKAHDGGLFVLLHPEGLFEHVSYSLGGEPETRRAIPSFNLVLKAFYVCLLAAGKRKKVALVAYMHKLLSLNAIARTWKPWDNTVPMVA